MARIKKRGPGRPSLGDAGQTRIRAVRLTPALDAQVVIAAGREEQTVSDWLRAAAELAIARGGTR